MNPIVALVQGMWPLTSMCNFLAVTGPKTDLWLVKPVGLMLAAIGVVLIYAQRSAAVVPPVALLAIGAAASLVIVEIVYVLKKGISPIFLGDAFVEIVRMVWWAVALSAA
jgi:hypothetical protein